MCHDCHVGMSNLNQFVDSSNQNPDSYKKLQIFVSIQNPDLGVDIDTNSEALLHPKFCLVYSLRLVSSQVTSQAIAWSWAMKAHQIFGYI